MSLISTKRSLSDIWPFNKKKFFVLVDPEALTEESGAPSSIPTLKVLLSRKAKVIIACSFGNLQGIPLNVTEKQRETALRAFEAEAGMGFTNFFANLTPKEKMTVLAKVVTKVPETCSSNRGTGKTSFFASLSSEEKQTSLLSVFPNASFSAASTFPLVEQLSSILPGVSVKFAPDALKAGPQLYDLKPGEVLVLQNLRFYRNETSANGDERNAMAEILCSYCDVFVNDSFASANEVKSSNVALPRLLKHGAAGLLMEKELSSFNRLLTHPARPTAVVVGGTHVEQKLRLIFNLIGKVEKILVAGEVALPFLAAKGLPAGKGFVSNRTVDLAGESLRVDQLASKILRHAAATGVQVILPVDHITHSAMEPARTPFITQSAAVPNELYALDVGPQTLQLFNQELRSCRTVFWSGTLGVANIEGYDAGTLSFAKALAASGVFSVVGGRYTSRCVHRAGVAQSMSHLCSGGVSCLEILQANTLPAVQALSDAVGELDQSTVANVNELLRHLAMFGGCTSHQLGLISKKAVRRVYNAGDFLIYDGDRFSSMFIVAKGSLVACPKSLYGLSTAVRKISKGEVVGLYEFVTLHTATETVQVADQDTVVYQISNGSLNEAINESPELATQLIVNLSEPLRMRAVKERAEAASSQTVINADIANNRSPSVISSHGKSNSFVTDVIMDCISTITLHKVALNYRPFTPETGTCLVAQPFDGAVARVLFSVLRNSVFHHTLSFTGPLSAAAISAVVTTPIRLLSSGVPLHKLNIEDVIDASLISGALSLAPVAAHSMYVSVKSKTEVAQRKSLSVSHSVILAIACRAVIGLFAYPLIARRGADLLNVRSILMYLLKQALAVVLDAILSKHVRRVSQSI